MCRDIACLADQRTRRFSLCRRIGGSVFALGIELGFPVIAPQITPAVAALTFYDPDIATEPKDIARNIDPVRPKDGHDFEDGFLKSYLP